MKTLAESYASRCGGASSSAERRLFWRCLYRRSLPFLPVLFVLRPGYFRPDRELIRRAARACSLGQLNEEINDYRSDPANLSWLRQRANFRISTRRLQRIARECFATGEIRVETGKS